MTAGRGIVHSERSPDELRADGPRLWGLQFWVALPRELEQCAPAFAHHAAEAIPRVTLPGAQLGVVLGEAYGATSPVALTSPMFLVDVRLDAGASIELEADHPERAVYVLEGEVHADDAAAATPKEHLIVFDPAEPARLTAVGAPAHVVLLGGPPLDAPRFLWWNFVSSERDLILQAQAAWSEQRFPQVPGETEYIPLPSRPLPPAPTPL
jgi:redox-sensitive bicupin YhaK (pirin superfamily)